MYKHIMLNVNSRNVYRTVYNDGEGEYIIYNASKIYLKELQSESDNYKLPVH